MVLIRRTVCGFTMTERENQPCHRLSLMSFRQLSWGSGQHNSAFCLAVSQVPGSYCLFDVY